MKLSLKFKVTSILITLIILTVLIFIFGGFKVKRPFETKEQIEYRELYQKLFADDVLTEKEMKQLDQAFKKAYPSNG